MEVERARECLISMGETSENVAEQYGIGRDKQDKMALESQQKALRAQKEGRFKDEIVPVTVTVKTDQGIQRSASFTDVCEQVKRP
jgi:acetyl-CoA acyltransferase 1